MDSEEQQGTAPPTMAAQRPPLPLLLPPPPLLRLLLLLGPALSHAQPFLFMDLEDVQGPWGLLQPRASAVTPNASFAPPCAPPGRCSCADLGVGHPEPALSL